MADNDLIRGAYSNINASTDELTDGSKSPQVTLLVGDGTPTKLTPSSGLADNAAFTDGTTRVTPAGFVYDEVAGTALTENDAAAARIDVKRAQVGVIEDATTRGNRAAVVSASETASATTFGVVTREVGLLDTLGAVTASPTSNTVLDRLKTIATNQTSSTQTIAGTVIVADPGTRWSYAAASGGIDNTTTAVTIIAAAGDGIRNYVSSIQIACATLGASTEFAIRDGAGGTVLWRTLLHTTAMPTTSIVFNEPLKGTAATLLEIVTLTAVTGDVMFNAQGFQAA